MQSTFRLFVNMLYYSLIQNIFSMETVVRKKWYENCRGRFGIRCLVSCGLTRWACLGAEEVISTSWSNMRRVADNIPLMKQQFVVIRTNRQTEIPALLDGLQAYLLLVLHPQKRSHFLKKHDMLKCCSFNELSCFSVFFKVVYRPVTTNWCFMSDLFHLKCKAVMFIVSLSSFFICTDSVVEKGKVCILQPLPTWRHRHTLKRGVFICCSYT
jgi:hypothetical protein